MSLEVVDTGKCIFTKPLVELRQHSDMKLSRVMFRLPDLSSDHLINIPTVSTVASWKNPGPNMSRHQSSERKIQLQSNRYDFGNSLLFPHNHRFLSVYNISRCINFLEETGHLRWRLNKNYIAQLCQ